MSEQATGGWWTRNLWVVVLFPVLAGLMLAGVSVFKGWLHRQAGFDGEGKAVNGTSNSSSSSKKGEKPLPARAPVAPADLYRRIVEDLQRRDPERRPYLRYLTLEHRHNNPACSAADLERDRQAVRELAGLLGKGSPNLVFLDPDQLLFRLDLKDLDWEPAADWHRIEKLYRYGLSGGQDAALAKLRQQAAELTGEEFPILRADWFVVALTRPPLAGPQGLVKQPLKDLPEAVQSLGQNYSTQTLDLASCAAELGLENAKPLQDLLSQSDILQKEFGLAPLLKGGTIRREWWGSDRNLNSPYQEAARLLKLGNPVRVQ